MKKTTIFILAALTLYASASESKSMRIGESQYFDVDGVPGEDVKITLTGVQNGVVTLKRENLKSGAAEIQYFYAAQGYSDPVAPIVLQPYSGQVYTDTITLSGICASGQSLFLYSSGVGEPFKSASLVKNVTVNTDGSAFSVTLPLSMGENQFYIAYGENVIGSRAQVNITRVEPPASELSADLDPVGSDNLRTTRLRIEGQGPGALNAIETVAGLVTGSADMAATGDGILFFPVTNTYTGEIERSFHLSYTDNARALISQKTLVVPVDEEFPVVSAMGLPEKLVPGENSVSGIFSDNGGVRFAWARILDASGYEVSRSYVDLGPSAKRTKGNFDLEFSALSSLTLKVRDEDNGVIGSSILTLPESELLEGYSYSLEFGVTDAAGNRSNVLSTELSAFAYEKTFEISLLDGIPESDIYAYPLLLRLTGEDVNFSTLQSSGSDLRFVDEDGNPLPFEIERFSKKLETAEIWIRIPRIEAYSASVKITALWGSSEAEYPAGRYVYDDGFRGVYHFNERYLGPYIPDNAYSGYIIYTTDGITTLERAKINGDVGSSGLVEFGQNSAVTGTVSENVAEMAFDISPEPNPGTKDISLTDGSSITLLPGKYGALNLNSRSQLGLSAGTYHFKSIALATDAKIKADVSGGLVAVKVQGDMAVAERTSVEIDGSGDASMIRFDVAGDYVNFGTDVAWKGILTAPYAAVSVKERMVWTGALYAKSLTCGTDVTFNPALQKPYYAKQSATEETFPPGGLSGFSLFAVDGITIGNSSNVEGTAGTLTDFSIGNDATYTGDVMAEGNLTLMNQSALVGNIILGGNVVEGSNVNWSGGVTPLAENMAYSIPEENVTSGTEDVYLANDVTLALTPGAYGALTVRARANLILSDGEYYFSNVYVEEDGSVTLNAFDKVSIYSTGTFEFRSRAGFTRTDESAKLKIYSGGNVTIGNDVTLTASVVAPNASAVLGDRTDFSGNIWAKSIVFGNQCKFTGSTASFTGGEQEKLETANVADYIYDATRFQNNGINSGAYAKSGWIAESEHFSAGNKIELKDTHYFGNGAGTWSCWMYLDGATGRILSSANASVPNWEWTRTAEGNLEVRIGIYTKTIPVPEEAWVYFSVVYSDRIVQLYLNGELVAAGVTGELQTDAEPWLGLSSAGTFKIDELRFSEVARDKDWVRLDYITQKKSYEPDDIVEYTWRF